MNVIDWCWIKLIVAVELSWLCYREEILLQTVTESVGWLSGCWMTVLGVIVQIVLHTIWSICIYETSKCAAASWEEN